MTVAIRRSARVVGEVEVAVEVVAPPQLSFLFDTEAADPAAEPLQWLEPIVAWVRNGETDPAGDTSAYRLQTLLTVLAQNPQHRERLRAAVAGLLASTSAVSLLSDVGADRDRGLWTAVAGRLSRRFFPNASKEDDLRPILRRLLGGEASARWLERLPDALLEELREVLDPAGAAFTPLASASRESIALLGAQASALGMSFVGGSPRGSPFWALPRACEALLAADSQLTRAHAEEQLTSTLEQCLERVEASLTQLEQGPVETALVLRTYVVRDALTRIGQLATTLSPQSKAGERKALLASLIRAQERYEAMVPLWAKAWKPLSRRIVEHTGSVGEHYITRNSEQWHRMVTAGAGAGALTVGTAALKLMIAAAGLSLFFSGLGASLNYALSFLLIQLFGFSLATKQPSMTAAALAAAVDVRSRDGALRKLSHEVGSVVRSQAASVLGNLGVVVPGAILVQWLSMQAGHPIVDVAQARYVAHSLDPIGGPMILFALFTGVLLWLSSIGGGWLENWARCRRVPQALAGHRGLRRLLGPARSARFASYIDHHLCGIGSNVTLGLLLGMVPSVSQFFGLGLDVRHVTLSSGSLGFAGAALGAHGVLEPEFLRAVAGIGFIAVANLGVSFGLGLVVALRARGLQTGALPLLKAVLWGIWSGIRRQPPAMVRLLRTVPPPTSHR